MLNESAGPADADHRWFRDIYDRHWRQVYAYCLHHTGNETVAEEILQEVFMSVWERRHALDLTKAIEGYLVASAKYKIIDHFRAQAVHSRHARALVPARDWETTTEDMLAEKEMSEQVEQLVSSLPPQSQLVYQLSREQGMPNRQIADKLLISEKTVEYHLTKALAVLRKRLLPFR